MKAYVYLADAMEKGTADEAMIKIRKQLSEQCNTKVQFDAAISKVVRQALALHQQRYPVVDSGIENKQKKKSGKKKKIVIASVICSMIASVAIGAVIHTDRSNKCKKAQFYLSHELNKKAEWQESCNDAGCRLDGSCPAIDACMEEYHYSYVREQEDKILRYCGSSNPTRARLVVRLGSRR